MPRGPLEERYTILSELGRGGMGVVYSALDAVRGEPVALKRLSIERFETPHDRERATALFEREYHTLSQLAHPNVISVFDYGVDDRGPYYTMEQLQGESLRARTPLPWREAARLVRDVASALAIVHSRRLVHRDVTPQNIYCHPQSGAKLIDFGAMMPVGVAKQIVGTPPFIAPECIELQPLDGQTDLFALGASLYYAISGRHAYPARSIDQLAAAWQLRPMPLSQLAPGVPEALDALVESLLSLSPAARPRTAADVYERLTSIAELPRSESSQVLRAYLTRPALVGRTREVEYLRRRAKRAIGGRGSSLILIGEPGIGRTRMLDSAVLEASLAGFLVARADASDSQGRPLGALERLVANVRDAGALAEPDLAQYGLEPLLGGASDRLLSAERRDQSLRDLASVLLALAKQRPLAIAVDDLQALDDPSLAVLASVAAQASGNPLWLIGTLDSAAEQRQSAALRLLWNSSRQLTLRPLEPEASRALLSSVFGDAPNLDRFSALCERRCLGNPRHLMECAQAAIDAGLARYSGGAWAITNDAQAIAETLDRLTDIERQIATLSPDAVELLEALAFDRENVLDLFDYPALTEHADRARMHRALTELVDAGWLVVNGDRARFRRDDQLARVAARVPPERAREIHRRHAKCCEKPELAPIYRAYHWVMAGELERSLLPMDEMTRFVDANPRADAVRSPVTLEALQLFCEMSDVPGAHPAAAGNYAGGLVINAMYQGFPERAAALIPRAFRELAKYTGVDDYRALANLPAPERLMRALTLANERCKAPGIGGLDLIGLMRRQTQLCIATPVCATFLADTSLLEGIPDLTPFISLSPALAIAQRLVDALSKLARGQTWLAWDVLREVHEQLSSPQAETIDGLTLLALSMTAIGYLCACDAEHASPETLAHLDQYAKYMAHNAQSVRARYYFALGDLTRWASARQQSELLSVQSNSLLETRHTDTAGYLGLFALAEDLLGLRRVHGEIVELTKTRSGWRYREAIARCQILRCEGRAAEALAIAESSLTSVPVLHGDFVHAASTHLELLLATERWDAARSAGHDYLERARAAGLPEFRIELALAHAHAGLGELDAAERIYGEALRALGSRDVRGLLLGRAFETGARVALRRGDATAFEARARSCAEHYAVRHNPTLASRFTQLMRDAARAGVIGSGPAHGQDAPADLALRALASAADDDVFYAAVLDHLVKRSGAFGGYLYVPRQDALRCVARTEGLTWTDSSSVDRAANEYYARVSPGAIDDVDEPTKVATTAASTTHSRELTLWPFALSHSSGHDRSIEAVVVFVSDSASAAGVSSGSLEELASLLTRRADAKTEATSSTHD
jgi:tetratricopeptide (TPR) repeat protein